MELIPGFVQGAFRVLVSYPVDYLRTNIQAKKTKTMSEFFRDVKPRMMYKGVSVPLTTVPIDRSINFFLYEMMKQKEFSSFSSACLSTAVSSLYSIPLSFFSTNLIVERKGVKETWILLKNKSLFNTFRGGLPEISRSFIASTLFMTTYGILREQIPKEHHNYVLFGVASSISSWSVTYPLDTLRVMKQTSQSSYIECLKEYRGLYRGFSLILLRALPSAGVGMFAYEKTRDLLCLNKKEDKQ